MTNDNFGTLKMLRDECGDVTREGLKMSLIDDDTASLQVWVVSGIIVTYCTI